MRITPCILLMLLLAGSLRAIIVTDYTIATNSPTEFDWSYVCKFNGSSAVAVGSRWLLTAVHVADDTGNSTVTVGGQVYNQVGELYHSTADLALIQLDKDLPGHYSIYEGRYRNKPLGIMVGYGVTGTVVDQYNYTFGSSGKGIERWGYNKIDGEFSYVGGIGRTNSGFRMYFNTADTANEAGAGTGDSGGGVFVNNNETWMLAGISTDVNTGGSQDYILAVNVQDYITWINSVIIGTNDFDADGLPNYWEQQYGTVTGIVASIDQDGDGLTGEQEYIADTNPTNAASFFEIDSFAALADQTVYFIGSTGREYQVFYTTNDLADSNLVWAVAHTNLIWGTGTNSFITVTNTDDRAFYRLRVTLP